MIDIVSGRVAGFALADHLPDHDQQVTRCLYQLLNQVRDRVRESLAA